MDQNLYYNLTETLYTHYVSLTLDDSQDKYLESSHCS